MNILSKFRRSASGTSSVELALTLPVLTVLLFGSVELGNYFLDQHRLVKAVRDGARYAARQDLSNYTGCGGAITGTQLLTNTQNVIMTGLTTGGSNRLPNWNSSTVTMSVSCTTTAGGTTLLGVYRTIKNSSGTVVGAPIVTVTASVPYTPVIMADGFSGIGFKLNASQQAAVMGW